MPPQAPAPSAHAVGVRDGATLACAALIAAVPPPARTRRCARPGHAEPGPGADSRTGWNGATGPVSSRQTDFWYERNVRVDSATAARASSSSAPPRVRTSVRSGSEVSAERPATIAQLTGLKSAMCRIHPGI